MDIENAKAQMRKGVLEMCILAIIGEEDTYGKAISDRLKAHDLIVVEGTLYPLLSRLKNDGLVDYFWQESTTGPPRKYLKITDLGRQFLGEMTEGWQQLVQSIGQIVENVQREVSPKEATPEPEIPKPEFHPEPQPIEVAPPPGFEYFEESKPNN